MRKDCAFASCCVKSPVEKNIAVDNPQYAMNLVMVLSIFPFTDKVIYLASSYFVGVGLSIILMS